MPIIKPHLWLKVTLSIFIGTVIGAYISGESTRKLDSEYLINDVRYATQLSTTLLANILSLSVATNNTRASDDIIEQAVKKWPEATYIHIEDYRGFYYTEWGKLYGVGLGIQKFEAPITLYEQDYGMLCIYVDLRHVYKNVESHISEVRKRSALILIAISLLVIAFVDLLITQNKD